MRTSLHAKTHLATHVTVEGHFLAEGSKVPLYYKKQAPEDRSGVRLQVAVLHDLMEYHRYQQAPGRYLIDKMGAEAEVAWVDFMGHGLSGGTRQHVDSFGALMHDLHSFLVKHAFAPGADPDARRLVVATGLGALAMLRLLQTRELVDPRPHGLVLAGPLVRPLLKGPRIGAGFLKKWQAHVGKVRVPLPPRSLWVRGQKLIETQSSDPLVGTSLPLSLLLEINHNAEQVRRDSFFTDIPTLIQVGAEDPIADVETSRIFHKGLGRSVAEWREYPGMRHDVYNDPGADRPLEDVYNWVYEKLLPARAPGRARA